MTKDQSWAEFLAAVEAALAGDSGPARALCGRVRMTHGPIVAQQQERELRNFISAVREGKLVPDRKGGYEAR